MQEILSFLQHHWLLSLALIIVLLLLVILEFIKIRRGTNQLSPAEVIQLINRENATIIDIRPANIYSDGHIVGAISLPLRELNDKIKKIEKFKTGPVVIICSTGIESPQAITLLQKNGFQRVYRLNGGVRAWKAADMPLVKD